MYRRYSGREGGGGGRMYAGHARKSGVNVNKKTITVQTTSGLKDDSHSVNEVGYSISFQGIFRIHSI